MKITRRALLAGAVTAPALVAASRLGLAAQPRVLKISHQFPGGTIEAGDFRDRLCRRFAAEVTRRTNGELAFEIYPGSSLMKTNAQFSALRKGGLDLSLYPMPYAGGEVHELNLGLMPGLVTSYEQGMAWKGAPIGQALSALMADKGVVLLTWMWQAGGLASRSGAIIHPRDAAGLKVRGGSREMDMVLKAAGAAVSSIPSNEIYVGMQTGAIDAALTSSTSLISFKLEELSKNLTTGRDKAYWFMCEPLLMSKAIFDSLSAGQREAVLAVGAEMEAFGLMEAKKDDRTVAEIYQKAGIAVHDIDAATVEEWRAIARDTAWKDFADKSENAARFLKMAEAVA